MVCRTAHYFEEAEILEYSKNFVETDHELEGLERLTAPAKRREQLQRKQTTIFEVNAKLLASLLEHRARNPHCGRFVFSRTAYVASVMFMLARAWIYSVYFTPAPGPIVAHWPVLTANEIFPVKVVESFSDDDLMEAVDASDRNEIKREWTKQPNNRWLKPEPTKTTVRMIRDESIV